MRMGARERERERAREKERERETDRKRVGPLSSPVPNVSQHVYADKII